MKYCVDVLQAQVLGDYKLHLYFDDGSDGVVDISKIVPFEGVFLPLKDKQYFSRLFVNKDTGTICWDNGADISPSRLHESIE